MSPLAAPPMHVERVGVSRWEERGDEKIQSWHLERLAVVYIRQSTAHQVVEHPESTRLQYGLAARAQALGWSPERIVVIADDLGKSARARTGDSASSGSAPRGGWGRWGRPSGCRCCG